MLLVTILFRVVVALDPATFPTRLRRRPVFGWRRPWLVSDASVVTAVLLAANVVASIGVGYAPLTVAASTSHRYLLQHRCQ